LSGRLTIVVSQIEMVDAQIKSAEDALPGDVSSPIAAKRFPGSQRDRR